MVSVAEIAGQSTAHPAWYLYDFHLLSLRVPPVHELLDHSLEEPKASVSPAQAPCFDFSLFHFGKPYIYTYSGRACIYITVKSKRLWLYSSPSPKPTNPLLFAHCPAVTGGLTLSR